MFLSDQLFLGHAHIWLKEKFPSSSWHEILWTLPRFSAFMSLRLSKVILKYSNALSSVSGQRHPHVQTGISLEASWSVLIMCSITGVGERLHKVFGTDWLKPLVSMLTKSCHKHGKNVVDMKVTSVLIRSSSNLQVIR